MGTSESLLSELSEVELNNSKQWILTSTKKEGSPILLFIHGGPGSVLLPFSHHFDQKLWNNFTVIHWDQRLAGKSYDESDKNKNVSIDTYVQDCVSLVKLLKEKYVTSKFYILGHSWGSIVGLLSANKLVGSIDGYIGLGQLVNDSEGQKLGYEYVMRKSNEAGDVTVLEKLGVPPYKGFNDRMKLSQSVMKYGGVFSKVKMQVIGDAISNSPHYTKKDLEKQEIGMKVSQEILGEKILKFDARESISSIKVKSWFIHGQDDYATPLSLLKNFYQKLDAPKGKKLISIEDSGHFPFWDDPKKFAQILEGELL